MRKITYFFDTSFFYTKLFSWADLGRILALVILCQAPHSFAMQRLALKIVRKQTEWDDWRKHDQEHRDICYKAAKRGDVAVMRALLQSDAEKYVPRWRIQEAENGITRMGKLTRLLLQYKLRNGRLEGHFLDSQIQEDLDRLACIAVIRLDRPATSMLLEAGADIEAVMTTEFTDEQVRQVIDAMRKGLVSFHPNKYTPLLYVAGHLDIAGDKDPTDLELVRDLVRAGADFHRPTPSGQVPYNRACEPVRAEIDLITRKLGGGEQLLEQEGKEEAQGEQDGDAAEAENQECIDRAQDCFQRVKAHGRAPWAAGVLLLTAGVFFDYLRT